MWVHVVCVHAMLFTWLLEIWTRVHMLIWRPLTPLNHLSSTSIQANGREDRVSVKPAWAPHGVGIRAHWQLTCPVPTQQLLDHAHYGGSTAVLGIRVTRDLMTSVHTGSNTANSGLPVSSQQSLSPIVNVAILWLIVDLKKNPTLKWPRAPVITRLPCVKFWRTINTICVTLQTTKIMSLMVGKCSGTNMSTFCPWDIIST